VAGLERYEVNVVVDPNATLGSLVGQAVVLRIDVTVTDPLGRSVRLSAYRTNA
jgi:hypothetical protein